MIDIVKTLIPGGILTIWCLWAVNWRKAWPALAAGGWIALSLIAIFTAYVWSLVNPRSIVVAGLTLPNYGWQLGAVGILLGVALFCGWLQGRMGWEPEVINLEPPAPSHGHGHH